MGVVTVEVVFLVPAPALRRAVEGRGGAMVVVAVVTGRGRWRGRGGAGGGVAGGVPVPATGGNVNAFKASSTLTLDPIGHDPPGGSIWSPCPSCC